eukprot:8585996-Pyramimonas_sp.AAC.2
MAGTKMWRKVHGPIAAVQATLVLSEWGPTQAGGWHGLEAQGDEGWQFPLIDENGRCDTDAIECAGPLGDLERDFDDAGRRQAATHKHGDDLAEGG